MFSRNLSGIFWACAIVSPLTGPARGRGELGARPDCVVDLGGNAHGGEI